MKRIFVCLLVFVMLLSAITVPIVATESGSVLMSEGVSFNQEMKYEMSVLLEDIPFVIEAWIYFPADFQGYGGVIVGNYGIIQPSYQLEILAGGKPQLYYTNPTEEMYEKLKYNLVFENVNVYSGEWVHLAVAIDDSIATAECYVNGELAEKIENIQMFDEDVLSVPFAVGGDHRGHNSSYFRGKMRSLALYSEYRDRRKIKVDMLNVDTRDDALLAYYDFTEASDHVISDHKDGTYNLTEIDKWLNQDEVEAVEDYAYWLCIVGDTQIEAYYDPDKFHYIYD